MLHIRWFIRRDLPEVAAIETASFEYAWTEDDFERVLKVRNCIGMVAEQSDKKTGCDVIVGFMVYELHKDRLVLLNFAVHPECRRRGVGSELMTKLRYKLTSHRREKLVTTVRESNLGALAFFSNQGLRATSVARRYYADSGDDGYVMEYTPNDEEWTEFGGRPINRTAQFENK